MFQKARQRTHTHNGVCLILTAESFAIHKAIYLVIKSNIIETLVSSDSFSVINNFKNTYYANDINVQIQNLLLNTKANCNEI